MSKAKKVEKSYGRPSSGGSYVVERDGKLKRLNEQNVKADKAKD